MDDDVASVHQNPVPLGHPFDPARAKAGLFNILHEVARNRANMTIRPPRCDNHIVRKKCFARQVDRDRVEGFIVVEGLLH